MEFLNNKTGSTVVQKCYLNTVGNVSPTRLYYASRTSDLDTTDSNQTDIKDNDKCENNCTELNSSTIENMGVCKPTTFAPSSPYTLFWYEIPTKLVEAGGTLAYMLKCMWFIVTVE